MITRRVFAAQVAAAGCLAACHSVERALEGEQTADLRLEIVSERGAGPLRRD